MSLTDHVAIVTGGGRGLGRSFALALADQGAAVAVVARSEDQLRETVRLIDEAGGSALAVPCDVTDRATRTRCPGATSASRMIWTRSSLGLRRSPRAGS